MKKINLLIYAIFLWANIYSNPVESLFVNEFARYDSSWAIEIMFMETESLDGFVLISNTDTAKIINGLTQNEYQLFVITPNELGTHFSFNYYSDVIIIVDTLSLISHQFMLGDIVPTVGQSISLINRGYEKYYYLDNSPTIGFPNDTLDACGNLSGYITDKSGKAIEGVKLIYDYFGPDSICVITQSDGYFNIHDIARKINLTAIYNDYVEYFWAYTWGFQIFPDSNACIDTIRLDIVSGINEASIPSKIVLYKNYPNPFNPTTKIKFSIPHSQFATLKVYDILGREIKTLVNKQLQPGNYEIEVNGTDLTSGVYLYILRSEGFVQVEKMILLK